MTLSRAALAALLIALPALAGCATTPGVPPTAASCPDDPGTAGKGPWWCFEDTDGAAHTRDAPAGNATVIFFMASWCGSCQAKAPVFRDAHAAYAGEGLRTYSVSWDATDDAASLEAWKAEHDQPWPHGVDPGFAIQKIFGITSQSSAVVLDGDGVLVRKFGYGQVTATGLRAAVEQALG